MYNMALDSTTN
jgi:intraflagellar transport protein 88